MPKYQNRGEKRHKRRLKVKSQVRSGRTKEHDENRLTRTPLERGVTGIVGRPTSAQRDEAEYRRWTK